MNSESLVIIPTYNEIENIKSIIEVVFHLPVDYDILIIDDNSPDGTADVVKQLREKYSSRLHLLERKGKMGLGTAYIAGFKWAIAHEYQYIFEMDADFSHNPKDLTCLYKACAEDGADLAIGSRYISGVNVVNWPISRVLMSYFASRYVKIITGMHIHDTTAGFKCYRAEVLKTINLDKIHFKGYAFQIEMKFKAYRLGFKLKEIPIVFTDRTKGKSKMDKRIIWEAVIGVIKLKIKAMFFKGRFN